MIQYDISESLKQFYFLNGRSVCPLIVGVSGHPDILPEAKELIREKVRETLKQLCKIWMKANGKKDVPILILDALVKGADQLVAEVVLELKKSPITQCLKLVSVLPCPWSEYQKDFGSSDELSAVETLRAQADAEIVIRNQPELPESERYVALAKVLAHSSYLLLALWDGKDGKPGGTGDVVRFQLEGTYADLDFMKESAKFPKEPWFYVQPCGGVFQIVTPREGSETPFPNAGECGYCVYQDNEITFIPRAFKTFLKDTKFKKGIDFLGGCNRDMMWGGKGDVRDKEMAEMYLLYNFHPTEGGNLAALVRYYTEFDILSIYYFKSFFHFLKVYMLSIISLGLIFYVETLVPKEWFDHFVLFRPCLDILYYFVLCWIFGLSLKYYWTPSYDISQRYRAVAESLRIQIFWYMANLSEPVTNFTHHHVVPPIDWVRNTLNTILFPICVSYDRPEDHPNIEYVYERWLNDQDKFLKRRGKSHAKRAKKWQKIQEIWGIMALFWLCVRLWPSRIPYYVRFKMPVTGLAILLAMAGVFLSCFYMRSYYESLAIRYNKLREQFKGYCNYLAPNDVFAEDLSTEEVQKAMYNLGKEMYLENVEWALKQFRLTLPR